MARFAFGQGFALTVCLGSLVGAVACSSRVPEPTESRAPVSEGQVATARSATSNAVVDALRPHLARTTAGLSARDGQNGGRVLPLEGRYHSAEVAHRAADGSIHVECVTSMKELEAIAATRAP